ncbi:hypothetical protein GQ42DRAFT_37199 [Ramicandelaber brevisporus]|nr:hypothetical protein GQ42DRAFT_37199 [Ramicandelaber brevisporus]
MRAVNTNKGSRPSTPYERRPPRTALAHRSNEVQKGTPSRFRDVIRTVFQTPLRLFSGSSTDAFIIPNQPRPERHVTFAPTVEIQRTVSDDGNVISTEPLSDMETDIGTDTDAYAYTANGNNMQEVDNDEGQGGGGREEERGDNDGDDETIGQSAFGLTGDANQIEDMRQSGARFASLAASAAMDNVHAAATAASPSRAIDITHDDEDPIVLDGDNDQGMEMEMEEGDVQSIFTGRPTQQSNDSIEDSDVDLSEHASSVPSDFEVSQASSADEHEHEPFASPQQQQPQQQPQQRQQQPRPFRHSKASDLSFAAPPMGHPFATSSSGFGPDSTPRNQRSVTQQHQQEPQQLLSPRAEATNRTLAAHFLNKSRSGQVSSPQEVAQCYRLMQQSASPEVIQPRTPGRVALAGATPFPNKVRRGLDGRPIPIQQQQQQQQTQPHVSATPSATSSSSASGFRATGQSSFYSSNTVGRFRVRPKMPVGLGFGIPQMMSGIARSGTPALAGRTNIAAPSPAVPSKNSNQPRAVAPASKHLVSVLSKLPPIQTLDVPVVPAADALSSSSAEFKPIEPRITKRSIEPLAPSITAGSGPSNKAATEAAASTPFSSLFGAKKSESIKPAMPAVSAMPAKPLELPKTQPALPKQTEPATFKTFESAKAPAVSKPVSVPSAFETKPFGVAPPPKAVAPASKPVETQTASLFSPPPVSSKSVQSVQPVQSIFKPTAPAVQLAAPLQAKPLIPPVAVTVATATTATAAPAPVSLMPTGPKPHPPVTTAVSTFKFDLDSAASLSLPYPKTTIHSINVLSADKLPKFSFPSLSHSGYSLSQLSTTTPTSTSTTVAPAITASASVPETSAISVNPFAKFLPKAGEWTCDTCLSKNVASDQQCAACEAPKGGKPAPSTASAPKPTPKPAVTASATAPVVAPPMDSSNPFAKFLPKADEWTCSTCLGKNKISDQQCAACEAPKPGSSKAPAPKPAVSALPPMDSSNPFAKFMAKPGEWTCGTCLSKNKPADTQCAACEAPKP